MSEISLRIKWGNETAFITAAPGDSFGKIAGIIAEIRGVSADSFRLTCAGIPLPSGDLVSDPVLNGSTIPDDALVWLEEKTGPETFAAPTGVDFAAQAGSPEA